MPSPTHGQRQGLACAVRWGLREAGVAWRPSGILSFFPIYSTPEPSSGVLYSSGDCAGTHSAASIESPTSRRQSCCAAALPAHLCTPRFLIPSWGVSPHVQSRKSPGPPPPRYIPPRPAYWQTQAAVPRQYHGSPEHARVLPLTPQSGQALCYQQQRGWHVPPQSTCPRWSEAPTALGANQGGLGTGPIAFYLVRSDNQP